MANEAVERVVLVVRGRVQGVAFRWHTRVQALTLGVTGTVRNRADGSVRIVAEGARVQLEALCDWAAHGPDSARVDSRDIEWHEASGEFSDFQITG